MVVTKLFWRAEMDMLIVLVNLLFAQWDVQRQGLEESTSTDDGQDMVVSMVCIDPEDKDQTVMVISEKGMGKRTLFEEFRLTNRGGKGVKNMQLTDKTGKVVATKMVRDDDDLMITNRSGIVIRMAVSDVRVMGRATQGVRVIRIDDNDEIADVAVVRDPEDEEDLNNGEDGENNEASENNDETANI
jgi:DNA gyrase subunit A